MAAEKLTRGRFVQIIIMLTLLISAFIWRTVVHTSQISVTCEETAECVFFVNNSRFFAQITSDELQIRTDAPEVTIKAQFSPSELTQKNDIWTFSYPESLNEFELTVNVVNQTHQVIIVKK